jgi:lysozyme
VKIRRVIFFLLIGLVAAAGVATWLIFTGRWIPNAVVAAAYPIRGIDVSHHQGLIDWRRAASDHVDFVFMKATEGADFVDKSFAENWKGAAANGVLRGAYHFYNPAKSGRHQAQNFIAVVPIADRTLPPVVDLEFAVGKGEVAAFRKELGEFLAIVRTHYGKEPIIYTTEEFRRHYLSNYPISRLWIREVVGVPKNSPQRSWMFWQFSSRGRVRGISTYVDLNVFAGEKSQLDALVDR